MRHVNKIFVPHVTHSDVQQEIYSPNAICLLKQNEGWDSLLTQANCVEQCGGRVQAIKPILHLRILQDLTYRPLTYTCPEIRSINLATKQNRVFKPRVSRKKKKKKFRPFVIHDKISCSNLFYNLISQSFLVFN